MPDPIRVTRDKTYDTLMWGECPARHLILPDHEGRLPHVADPHGDLGAGVCSWCGTEEVPLHDC